MKFIRRFAIIAAFAATCVTINTSANATHQLPSTTAVAGAAAAAGASSISSSGVVLQNNTQPVQTTTTTANGGDTVVNSSGGNNSVTSPRQPVATAFAAPLTSGIDTCMGSTSAGVQAVGFGVSVGSTWVDENCKRLKNSRELRSMGYSEAALALMCQDPAVVQAMRTAGTPCVITKE